MENENTVAFDPQVKGELMNMFAMAAMQGSLAAGDYLDSDQAVARAGMLIESLEAWHTAERAKLIAAAQKFEAEQQAAADAAIPQQAVDAVVAQYPTTPDVPYTPGSGIEYAGEEPDSV